MPSALGKRLYSCTNADEKFSIQNELVELSYKELLESITGALQSASSPVAAMDRLQRIIAEQCLLGEKRLILFSRPFTDCIDVDVFWMMHITGLINFEDYVTNISPARVSSFLRNSIRRFYLENAVVDGVLTSSFAAGIFCYLYDLAILQPESTHTKSQQIRRINGICFSILDDTFISDSSTMNHLFKEDVTMFCDLLAILSCAASSTALAAFQVRQLSRLLSCRIACAEDEYSGNPLSLLLSLRLPPIISYKAVDRILKSDTALTYLKHGGNDCEVGAESSSTAQCVPAFTQFLELASVEQLADWREIASSAPTIEAISASYHCRGSVSQQQTMLSFGGLLCLAAIAARFSVAEASHSLLLRAVNLAEKVASAVRRRTELSEVSCADKHLPTTNMEVKVFSEWIDLVLGSKTGYTENGTASCHADSSVVRASTGGSGGIAGQPSETSSSVHPLAAVTNERALGFVCLALCDCVDYQSQTILAVLYKAVQSRRALNKEAVGIYLTAVKRRLRAIEEFRSCGEFVGLHDQDNLPTIPLDPERVALWATNLRRTGSLPAVVPNTVKMQGGNGHKAMMKAFKLLSTANPSLRTDCCEIIRALSETYPELCPLEDARKFLDGGKSAEAKLDVLLEDLAMTASERTHVKGILSILIHAYETASNGSFYHNDNQASFLIESLSTHCTELAAHYRHKNRIVGCVEEASEAGTLTNEKRLTNLRVVSIVSAALLQLMLAISREIVGKYHHDVSATNHTGGNDGPILIDEKVKTDGKMGGGGLTASSSTSSATIAMTSVAGVLHSWLNWLTKITTLIISSCSEDYVAVLSAIVHSHLNREMILHEQSFTAKDDKVNRNIHSPSVPTSVLGMCPVKPAAIVQEDLNFSTTASLSMLLAVLEESHLVNIVQMVLRKSSMSASVAIGSTSSTSSFPSVIPHLVALLQAAIVWHEVSLNININININIVNQPRDVQVMLPQSGFLLLPANLEEFGRLLLHHGGLCSLFSLLHAYGASEHEGRRASQLMIGSAELFRCLRWASDMLLMPQSVGPPLPSLRETRMKSSIELNLSLSNLVAGSISALRSGSWEFLLNFCALPSCGGGRPQQLRCGVCLEAFDGAGCFWDILLLSRMPLSGGENIMSCPVVRGDRDGVITSGCSSYNASDKHDIVFDSLGQQQKEVPPEIDLLQRGTFCEARALPGDSSELSENDWRHLWDALMDSFVQFAETCALKAASTAEVSSVTSPGIDALTILTEAAKETISRATKCILSPIIGSYRTLFANEALKVWMQAVGNELATSSANSLRAQVHLHVVMTTLTLMMRSTSLPSSSSSSSSTDSTAARPWLVWLYLHLTSLCPVSAASFRSDSCRVVLTVKKQITQLLCDSSSYRGRDWMCASSLSAVPLLLAGDIEHFHRFAGVTSALQSEFLFAFGFHARDVELFSVVEQDLRSLLLLNRTAMDDDNVRIDHSSDDRSYHDKRSNSRPSMQLLSDEKWQRCDAGQHSLRCNLVRALGAALLFRVASQVSRVGEGAVRLSEIIDTVLCTEVMPSKDDALSATETAAASRTEIKRVFVASILARCVVCASSWFPSADTICKPAHMTSVSCKGIPVATLAAGVASTIFASLSKLMAEKCSADSLTARDILFAGGNNESNKPIACGDPRARTMDLVMEELKSHYPPPIAHEGAIRLANLLGK